MLSAQKVKIGGNKQSTEPKKKQNKQTNIIKTHKKSNHFVKDFKVLSFENKKTHQTKTYYNPKEKNIMIGKKKKIKTPHIIQINNMRQNKPI